MARLRNKNGILEGALILTAGLDFADAVSQGEGTLEALRTCLNAHAERTQAIREGARKLRRKKAARP